MRAAWDKVIQSKGGGWSAATGASSHGGRVREPTLGLWPVSQQPQLTGAARNREKCKPGEWSPAMVAFVAMAQVGARALAAEAGQASPGAVQRLF